MCYKIKFRIIRKSTTIHLVRKFGHSFNPPISQLGHENLIPTHPPHARNLRHNFFTAGKLDILNAVVGRHVEVVDSSLSSAVHSARYNQILNFKSRRGSYFALPNLHLLTLPAVPSLMHPEPWGERRFVPALPDRPKSL